MNRIIALAALLLLAMPLPSTAAEQQYSVTSFESVRMQAPFRVTIVTGKGNSARGTGSRKALDRVSLNVSGGVLTIRAEAPRQQERDVNLGDVHLLITTDRVRRIVMSGSGSLKIEGMKGVRGDINLAGSGDLQVDGVAVDRLVVNGAGSGSVRLSGTAGEARVHVIGAGTIEASELVAQTLVLDSQGPGSVTMTAVGSADVELSGSGDVTVRGKAACKVSQAGSGSLKCGGE